MRPLLVSYATIIDYSFSCVKYIVPIEKTMNEDGNLIVKVRPHNCAAYSHAATRRVCDRLAVLLNEHFDAIGD